MPDNFRLLLSVADGLTSTNSCLLCVVELDAQPPNLPPNSLPLFLYFLEME